MKDILEKGGIRCFVRNEQMAQTIPGPPFAAELWVAEEADYASATGLISEWVHPTHTGGPEWVCVGCGEHLGSQFTKCWKCGTQRYGEA